MKLLEIKPETLALTLITGKQAMQHIDAEFHKEAIEQTDKLIKELCRCIWDTDAILWIIEKP